MYIIISHTKTDIEFGKHFQTGNTSKSCDIYYKEGTIEKFIELKNVDFSNINDLSILNTGATSMQRIEQVIGQKGAFSRINNLNEYEWVATALKNDDINHLKQLWKEAITNNLANSPNVFDVIWANDNLRTSLFGNIPLDQLDDFYDAKKVIFDNWINTMDNNIFKFVKIE